MGRPIYVETFIEAPLEAVWEHTQDPARHEAWDMRFTSITYLPRPDPAQPQRFRYATRIGPGATIEGWGETRGSKETDGSRTSALAFGSDDPKSLMRAGSGYWKYEEVQGRTRFHTRYDYEPRFGFVGRAADVVFRPLIGWATALSFDRLRLWLERGIPPATSLRAFWAHAVARWVLALVFLYQGLVPKVLGQDADELAMMAAGGVPPSLAGQALTVLGVAEALFGVGLLLAWRSRLLLWLALLAMPIVTAGVLATAPHYAASAFNVVSLNLGVLGLAVVALLAQRDMPSAGRTRRTPA